MSKTNKDERAENWAIVINSPNNRESVLNLETDIYRKLKNFKFIACITHEPDEYNNTLHYHAVIVTHRTRKETLLNLLSNTLEIPQNCISIEKALNLRACIRYLIHMDEDDTKQHYAPFMVLTNNERFYKDQLNERYEILSTELLLEIIENAKSYREILLKIGIDNFKKYNTVIKTIYESRRF